MRRLIPVLVAGLLASCAGPRSLEVKQFVLRDAGADYGEDPMVRSEKLRRLHGAIGVKEQAERLGQYYTVLWKDDSQGPVKVVFEYQQGGSGSRIKREVRDFDAASTSGQAEFSVVGENFRNNGRVLAWRISLVRNGEEIASRRSYLWQ